MFDGNRILLEEYVRLKSFEKGIELNLAVLKELEEMVAENLEEVNGYLQLIEEEKRLAAEKLKASLKTILQNLSKLQEDMENLWEELEFTLLKLVVHKTVPPGGFVDPQPIEDISNRLELLKEYINLQCSLLTEELGELELRKKFPAEIYTRFLEKLEEFNRSFWR